MTEKENKTNAPLQKKKKKALGLSELRKDFFGTRAEVDTCLSPATPNPDGGMSLEGNEAPVLGYSKWPDQQQAGRSRGEGKAFQKEKKKASTEAGRRECGLFRRLCIQAQSCTSPSETLSFSLPSKPKRQGYRL